MVEVNSIDDESKMTTRHRKCHNDFEREIRQLKLE